MHDFLKSHLDKGDKFIAAYTNKKRKSEKTTLLSSKLKVKAMKTVRKINGKCIYVFQGVCCANTHFVENKRESDQFLHYVKRYLGEYMYILEFSISGNGWTLLVKTKSSAIIRKNYLSKNERLKKKVTARLEGVSYIISNAIRLMRSHFTRWTNSIRSRKGNASKRRFLRYVFSSVAEAKSYIRSIRNQKIDLEQENMRYQANRSHFDEDGEISKNQEDMSSKIYQDREGNSVGKTICLKIMKYIDDKLEKWIIATCEVYKLGYETGWDKIV